MPIDALTDNGADRVRLHHGLRLAVAPAAIFAIGLLFGWPLFFVGAVFAAIFTQGVAPIPKSAGLALVAIGSVLMVSAWIIATVLDPYPVAFLLAVCIAVGLCFAASIRGANVLVIVFALLGALLVPFLVRISPDLAGTIVFWLPANLLIALLATWTAFYLFPAVKTADAAPVAEKAAFDPSRRLIRMCLITLPFVVYFFASGSDASLTVIFVAIQTAFLAASTESAPAVARGTLTANAAGGLAAVLIYEVLVIAPLLPVAMLAMLVACLFFAGRFTAGDKLAGSAMIATLILVGGSLGPISDEADVKMITRLWQIGSALLYLLAAFVVIDHVLPEKAPANAGLGASGQDKSASIQP